MHNSAIRNKSETIDIFVSTDNSESTQCDIFKLTDDGTFSQITYTPSITEIDTNIYTTQVTLPDEDCIVCIIFKKQPIVVRVGLPISRFIYYRINTGQTIPYQHYYHDGSSISNGNLIEAGSGFYYHDVYDYPTSIIEVDNTPYSIKLPYDSASGATNGTILIQNNVWQLIAIPRKGENVKEYFVDRLASKYSAVPEEMIEICTAYFGDENKFRSYIPGVTNPLTANNFPLVYSDGISDEITGFWVKTKDLTGIVQNVDDVKFDWSSV